MIGKTVSHYKILEVIGEGGLGIVYKAKDVLVNRIVAMKFLRPHATQYPDAVARFAQEAKAAASLSHPHITTIHEIDEDYPGNIFIVMEFLEGKNLKQKIEPGPLDAAEAIQITIKIAEGLKAAHDRNIVHRDIKSSNIMITEDNQVKITDFGLAKVPESSDLTKMIRYMGTAAYMSPEQAGGEPLDHRTDIWSLGVVLYEMVTANLPFEELYEQAVLYSLVNKEPEPISKIRQETPEGLEQIVRKAMEKLPENRYQSIDEMLQDLQHLSQHKPLKFSKPLKRGRSGGKRRVLNYFKMAAIAVLFFAAGYLFKGYFGRLMGEAAGADKNIRIAVLPFKSISADRNDDYFADGMTDEMISKLSRISQLRVIARTSVMTYKDTDKNIAEIGGELEVDVLLEGSIRKFGNKMDINVQLADVRTQASIWQDGYNRELNDMFTVQDEITLAIADQLKLRLVGEEENAVKKRYTENFAAYNQYLLGRYFWNQRTENSFRRAIGYFEKAIAEDATYAIAYAGLADTYNLLPIYSDMSPEEAYPVAKRYAEKAIALDETLAEAYVSMAFARYRFDFDWFAAESGFKRAIEINPSYATAYHWYAFLLTSRGRHEEAIKKIDRAFDLDPLSLIINTDFGRQYYYARQYDKAIERYSRTLLMEPDFAAAHDPLGDAYIQNGLFQEGINEYTTAIQLSGRNQQRVANLCYARILAGERKEALEMLDGLTKSHSRGHTPYTKIAGIYTALGDLEQAFLWLDKAFEERDNWLVFLKVAPEFDALRQDKRFHGFLEKVGLAD